ncbi:Zn(II)2Cys6 transcription factor [Aspergillus candidus]|uniref:Fungal-specific transcription factor domain-domain-containing protein n=1 Tax=Aspergillus candidus TaxID=41067 RepID=A0A2I2FET7_ASPCN|nr:fungal-specific transcription factor domain-domain-containing protein [Aspergillus candidus]PLB39148.1 fungal-specific transcription factor domain-domain-containing protein [Aspergillus candidus]
MSGSAASSSIPSTMVGGMYAPTQTASEGPSARGSSGNGKGRSITRSRSGCFTCRLRRKKCDEERPSCKACSKLGLKCDYRAPQWWATAEQRAKQKDRIKDRIRQTKVMEKEGSLKEYMDRIRALAERTPVTVEYDFSRPVFVEQAQPQPQPQIQPQPEIFAAPLPTPITPHDANANIRLNVNVDASNVAPTAPLYPESSSSAYTSLNAPEAQTVAVAAPELADDDWFGDNPNYDTVAQPVPPVNAPTVPPNRALSSCLRYLISVDDCDRRLFDHFVDNVIPLVFPILETHPRASSSISEVFHSMQSNRSYLQCCLSVSAVHLKTSLGLEDEMDYDIMKHRYEAVSRLSRTINHSSGQMQVMDATLAMIFYNCSMSSSDDYLPDISWSEHFKAVSNLVTTLNCTPTQFNVSLITWIDILGATILGKTPKFSHTYRTKHLSGTSSGLQQMMGCDDRVMYLISEIACLESLKLEGRVDDMTIYSHVSALNAQIEWTEPADPTIEVLYSSSGVVRPDQLTKVISTLFRLAARIYLLSLISGFDYYDPSIINLVASVTNILQCMPAGPQGFDRSLVWPLFITGAYSVPSSAFRKVLGERVVALGYLGDFGSFGRMYRVLKELWKLTDNPTPRPSGAQSQIESTTFAVGANNQLQQPAHERIHWREVMRRNKWDYLLI